LKLKYERTKRKVLQSLENLLPHRREKLETYTKEYKENKFRDI